MNILVGIISLIVGWLLGVFTRDILMKIIKIHRTIRRAEAIVERERKQQEFKKNYDFSDSFEEEKE